MPVFRRHVLYVSGFDPQGPKGYHRLFARELKRFAATHGVEAATTDPERLADGVSAAWQVTASDGARKVETTYEFLGWQDIIRAEMARPFPLLALAAPAMLADGLVSGLIPRLFLRNWRWGVFSLYPFFMLTVGLLLAAAAGWLARLGLAAALPASIAAAAGVLVAVAVAVLLVRYDGKRPLFTRQFLANWILDYAHARARHAALDARVRAFADRLVALAKAGEAQEIVLVGHSAGGFLGPDIFAVALASDPDLGRHGPSVSLVTVGSSMALMGFHRLARRFRARLATIATAAGVLWVEWQSRKDVMNLFGVDPIALYGVDLGGRERLNPTILQARFRDAVAPEIYARFRWNFFRTHFQFIMGNDRPAAYDYYALILGDRTVAERVAAPKEAMRPFNP